MGTASDLLWELTDVARRTEPSIFWPRNSVSLGRNIRLMKDDLEKLGIWTISMSYASYKRILSNSDRYRFDARYEPMDNIIILTRHPKKYLGKGC